MNKEELWKRLNEVFRDVFDDKKNKCKRKYYI